MKKSGRKILSVILTAVMVFALLPVFSKPMVAKAATGDKEVASLSTDVIKNPTAPKDKDTAWSGNYVWFGTYTGNPVKYRVLSNATTEYSGTTGAKTIFLDCDSILFETTIDDDGKANKAKYPAATKANEWQYSDLKEKLNGDMFLTGNYNGKNNFTTQEIAAIANSTKAGDEHEIKTSFVTGPDDNKWFKEYTGLTGEQIFVLDVNDTLNTAYGYSDYCGKNTDGSNSWEKVDNRKKSSVAGGDWYWWLRSPYSCNDNYVAVVCPDGRTLYNDVYFSNEGVSPAFNINLSSIIFSSLISGKIGKDGAEYKLTISDSDMEIALTTSKSAAISPSNIVSIPYSITGKNKDNATQVSVLILDDEWMAGNTNKAKIKYYSKLLTTDVFETSGTGSFDFSETGLNLSEWGKKYRVYILAEDVNGEKLTDYASDPVEIKYSNLTNGYDFWIDGEMVSEKNTSGNGWSYIGNENGGTLTLTDATITKNYQKYNICYGSHTDPFSLTISLNGTNSIMNGVHGIFGYGDLSIIGDGSLDINIDEQGIFSSQSIIIDGPTITASSSGDSLRGVIESLKKIEIKGMINFYLMIYLKVQLQFQVQILISA